VLKGRKVCEALDRPLGLHNPMLWPEERPEKSLFTDPDTGEQVFTAPNGQTYTRRIPNSHDDRVPECRERGGRGGDGRGAARDCRDVEFFGDADRSAEVSEETKHAHALGGGTRARSRAAYALEGVLIIRAMYTRSCEYTYTLVICTHTRVHARTHVFTHTEHHTYARARAHTHTHTHTHGCV